MSKMTNWQNDHGGRELNGEPTHIIIWEPYGILQSFFPHSLHSFNDFILLFIHSFPIRLLSHSFSYSSTLTVIPFNLTISLWQENDTLSWIAKTSKNGHFCVTTVSSWNLQELLPMTKEMSMQKVKVRGQRSRSQRSWPHLAVSGL